MIILNSLTSAINVNVNKDIKNQASAILKDLGLNMSTFINMALTQVVKKNGVPFEVINPKEESDLHKYFTKKELEKVAKELAYIEKNPEKYKSFNNVNDLFEELNRND